MLYDTVRLSFFLFVMIHMSDAIGYTIVKKKYLNQLVGARVILFMFLRNAVRAIFKNSSQLGVTVLFEVGRGPGDS